MPLRQREKIQELLRQSGVEIPTSDHDLVIVGQPHRLPASVALALQDQHRTRSAAEPLLAALWLGSSLQIVGCNLELVPVGIAEIDGVRDFVILEFEFDSALL